MHYYVLSDGNKYTNTFQAWQHFHSHNCNSISLELYDGLFDTVDWTKQPAILTKYAEDIRVKQIAEKHSYIRLLYSGGSDSQTILDAFIRNNVKIDEIIIISWDCHNDFKVDSYYNRYIKERWIDESYMFSSLVRPQIRHAEVTKKVFDQHFSKDWYLNGAGMCGVGSFNFNHQPEVAYLLAPPEHDNYIDVVGVDKPRVYTDGKSVWWMFIDKELFYNNYPNENKPIEWFYVSPECPELIISQCYGALNAGIHLASTLNIALNDGLQKLQREPEYYDLWCRSLGRTTTFERNTLSRGSKPRENSMQSDIYKHYNYYSNNNTIQWKTYSAMKNAIKDICGMDSFHGVETKKYVFKIL